MMLRLAGLPLNHLTCSISSGEHPRTKKYDWPGNMRMQNINEPRGKEWASEEKVAGGCRVCSTASYISVINLIYTRVTQSTFFFRSCSCGFRRGVVRGGGGAIAHPHFENS